MAIETGGLTVVVPAAGRKRLHLLDATLAGLRRSAGIEQIIVSECAAVPDAVELAARWNADYVFGLESGRFNKCRAWNQASPLAQCPAILWCDGDVLFDPDFPVRALAELHRRRLDYLLPFNSIHALDAAATAEVIAGQRRADECVPAGVYHPHHPGTMGLASAGFLQRHGGMIEGFRGWGREDNAWVHQVSLLGRIGWSDDSAQRAWHLYHPSTTRDISNLDANHALFRRIASIASAEELLREFPPPAYPPPPWNRSARIVFALWMGSADPTPARLANAWAECLLRRYGLTVPVLSIDRTQPIAAVIPPGAELVVAFAATAAECCRLAEGPQRCPWLLVPLDPAAVDLPGLPEIAESWILAPTTAQAERWRLQGARVWHRAWQASGTGQAAHAISALVQAIGFVLGIAKDWHVRIVLDRSALPHAALDRPPFWYIALHDTDGGEIARADADWQELRQLASRSGDEMVIERTVRAARLPAHWTVWPVDRRRQWLARMEGEVVAHSLAGPPPKMAVEGSAG